jgi:hypothetical protein
MSQVLCVQYFGDGAETDFDYPLDGIPSGYVPFVEVNGSVVDITYTAQVDTTPASVTISAPAANAIINLKATNDIIAVKTVQAGALVDEVAGAPSVAGAVDARVEGDSKSYIRTDVGAKTILAADADGDRAVIIVIKVTTAFANGDGAQPVVTVGETGSTSKFAANTLLVDAAAGTTFTLAGLLTDNTDLLATLTAATGSTSTGAFTISAIAVPKAS